MNTSIKIKVWDPLVRIFHWTLVVSFVTAYVTEDDFMNLHALAGYVIGGLLVFRVLWGFLGTRHARFADFVFSPRIVLAHIKETLTLKARRYLGHNPAGGAMIIALLVALTTTVLSGLALYAVGDQAGPLAPVLGSIDQTWEKPLGEIHEFLANFTLLLVILHVTGVVAESILHRENLVRAMWTGYKRSKHQNRRPQPAEEAVP